MQGSTSSHRPFDSAAQQHDRRKLPRRPISGGAMAIFSDGPGVGSLTRVDLIDASWTGLGVRCESPVSPGACVSLVPEASMMPRQTGVVVRCDQVNGAYHLGIRCRVAKAVA